MGPRRVGRSSAHRTSNLGRERARPARPLVSYSPAQIERSVTAGTAALVDSLLAMGRLSRQGPITDGDVETMVFVAVTTGELVGVLLEPAADVLA